MGSSPIFTAKFNQTVMNKCGAQHKVGRRRHTSRYALKEAFKLMPSRFNMFHLINEAKFISHHEYSESSMERELRSMRQDGLVEYVFVVGKKRKFKKTDHAKASIQRHMQRRRRKNQN